MTGTVVCCHGIFPSSRHQVSEREKSTAEFERWLLMDSPHELMLPKSRSKVKFTELEDMALDYFEDQLMTLRQEVLPPSHVSSRQCQPGEDISLRLDSF